MTAWRRIDELSPGLRQRWAAARVWAAHQAPYLATAVLALDPVVAPAKGDPSKFSGLRPAFGADGTITAANASWWPIRTYLIKKSVKTP